MSVAFKSSKRRRRLIEAMVLLRDWPLVLVICFANFLTNIIAWGPMPPVVEKHSGAKVPLSTFKKRYLYRPLKKKKKNVFYL